MAVQMKEVAERAGVSISTVSHVLNKTRPVAPQTRDRVLGVVRELNYYKNVFGRRLARGQGDAVGLIISDIENPFFPELIRNFETAAVERSLDTLICTTNYNTERAQHAIRRMIENRVQGVAVMTSQLNPALVDELVAADIPVVRLDAGPTGRARSNIRIDYSTGAAEAARHLRDLGHRRIGFIAGPRQRVSAVTFRKAVLEAIAKCGLPRPQVIEGDNTMDGGAAGMQKLLESKASCTAIVCGHDMAALGAIRTAIEAGRRVPEDVSILGADDIAFAHYAQPSLTTIRIPRDELGRMAFDALRRMIRRKRRPGSEDVLETHLVVRRSSGAAPGTT
jgi:DNA-binding LacI/PurR family transcriptional regulator